MSIQILNDGDQFTQNDACELLNSHVIRNKDTQIKNLTVDHIGYIAGVITLNDEIEVIIKFPDGIVQLTKSKFNQQITLLDMP